MPKLSRLALPSAPSSCLSDLKRLTGLTWLLLGGNVVRDVQHAAAIDATPLSAMHLASINCTDVRLQGAFHLRGCTALHCLLACNSLPAISSFSSLMTLDLLDRGFVEGQGLRGVLALPHLQKLALHGGRFNMLELQCPSLQVLFLHYWRGSHWPAAAHQREVSSLTNLTQLSSLYLQGLNSRIVLQPLKSLRYCPGCLKLQT